MQLTKTLIAALPLLASAAAAPKPPFKSAWWPWAGADACLPSTVASSLVDGFGLLLSNFTATAAENLLSPTNFTDTSDSINYIAGIDLGSVTFANQTAFIYGQGQQPAIDFTLLAIDSVSCEGVITFRWQAGVGTRKLPAKGITVLYSSLTSGGNVTTAGTGGWQITRVFSEFNSAAWIVDFGGSCPAPSF